MGLDRFDVRIGVLHIMLYKEEKHIAAKSQKTDCI